MSLQEQAQSQGVIGGEEEAIKELAEKIIQAAVADTASDVHIDPVSRQELKVRFRVDGVMHDVLMLPKSVHPPLTTRLKAMADLDTANLRTVQDGGFEMTIDDQGYILRETVLPSIWGEKVTLRISEQNVELVPLEALGMSEGDRGRFMECMSSPHGLLVVAGPTGHGRTTVTVNAIRAVMNPDIVVMTVEDPVEFRIAGAVQVHVNRRAGVTEATGLRGILRSDPDIIMVGSLPDLATAELAIEAANTGHLVLTPLLADSAAQAIQRLYDWGVDEFLLSHALVMVSSQRLTRRVCGNCGKPAEYPADLIAGLRARAEAGGFTWPRKAPSFRKGAGCDNCRGTGYRGRLGLFEVISFFDAELRTMIAQKADPASIIAAAVTKGMTTMFADAMAKAIAGQTTIEEITRVLHE